MAGGLRRAGLERHAPHAGFLNFQIGLGLGLLAAAADGRLARLRPASAFAVRAAAAALILLLELVADEGFARLYRVERPPSGAVAGVAE